MYGKADDQTEGGGADPAETEVREREICAHKVEHTIEGRALMTLPGRLAQRS